MAKPTFTHLPECRGVYAVENEAGFIKIGFSDNVRRRIRSIFFGTDRFRLLRVVEVAECQLFEFYVHARFWKYRVRGEWFRFDAAGRAELLTADLLNDWKRERIA